MPSLVCYETAVEAPAVEDYVLTPEVSPQNRPGLGNLAVVAVQLSGLVEDEVILSGALFIGTCQVLANYPPKATESLVDYALNNAYHLLDEGNILTSAIKVTVP